MRARLSIALGIFVLLSAVGLFALIVWPREAPIDCEARDPAAVVDERDAGGEVRLYGVCIQGEDETARVYVVDDSAAEDPVKVVRRCAGRFEERHDVVRCYAFSDDRAYSAAGVAADGSGMERECWTAWFERTRSEGGRGLSSNEDYEAQGCP